ncbi:MAG: hypothetical protein HYZ57_02460 [Acidobacteria bacterium]|nr:hypothetical protein [Acidobacteriota bacterium]
MPLSRPKIIACAAAAAACAALWAIELTVRPVDGEFQVLAPGLHFLQGKPLDRLRTGNTVAFDFQLSVLGDGKTSVLQRSFERFAISYDLWEERFSISRLRSKRGSASHLTAADAETWCIGNMRFNTTGIPRDKTVWVRLEIRPQNAKERDSALDEPGISLANLVDLFSRAARARDSDFWRVESSPMRLSDLLPRPGRGAD